MQKVVVILTDGNNTFYDHDTASGTPLSDYTAYGRLEALGVTMIAAGRALLDAREAATWAAMKAEGIRIYSIIFGAAPDSTAKALYETCATTKAMYYYAPSNATVTAAFKDIAGQLATLWIVK